MANKTVKRIKLDKNKPKTEKTVSSKTTDKVSKKSDKKRSFNPFTAFVSYVRGSWAEIRQVRWPNRRATWGMTLAVILFTVFFATIILLLDAAFQYLFKEILLK